MDCRDRAGRRVEGGEGQDRFLRGLYGTRGGRVCVKLLIQPWVSKLGGRVLNSRLSRVGIPHFIEKNKIDMSQYEERSFRSYNDFFMRRIKPEMRPVSMEATRLISPCDSRLTVHEITESSCFAIKGTMYTMESLLRDKALARVYDGGTLLLFRLTVDDYHRYCYVDSGQKSKNHWLPGVYHTVNPAAAEVYPIYKENTRCYSFIDSENFGRILQMEVGALMVGKIINYEEAAQVTRGDEKGRFEFGGSTIVVALPKGSCVIDADILENSRAGMETKVKYGEAIGQKKTCRVDHTPA